MSTESIHTAPLPEDRPYFDLLEDLHTPMMLHRGGPILFVNKAFEKLTGYARGELLGVPFYNVLHPDFRELALQRGVDGRDGVGDVVKEVRDASAYRTRRDFAIGFGRRFRDRPIDTIVEDIDGSIEAFPRVTGIRRCASRDRGAAAYRYPGQECGRKDHKTNEGIHDAILAG